MMMTDIEPTKKTRPKDELWETLLSVLGYSPKDITRNVRGQLNGALKQLREVEATPYDIQQRATIYRFLYPTLVLTPMGLVNRWADLTEANLTALLPEKIRNEKILEFHKTMDEGRIFDEMVKEGKIDAQGNPVKEIR